MCWETTSKQELDSDVCTGSIICIYIHGINIELA